MEEPKFTPYPEIWTRSYRAWVLVKVVGMDPEAVARDIFDLNDKVPFNKDTQGFIVRADVVSGSKQFEIVVPVNAPGEDELNAIVEYIFNLDGVESASSMRVDVIVTIPEKSHQAKGYIPFNERNPTIGIDGFNSWG